MSNFQIVLFRLRNKSNIWRNQCQFNIKAMMTLATLISLNTTELLQNGLQPYSGATPLFSIREVLLAAAQH